MKCFQFMKFWICLGLLVAGCGGPKTSNQAPLDKEDQYKLGYGSVVGEDFLEFGPGKKKKRSLAQFQVNPHLWRAVLDTLSFMPLASADAAGGVVTTDWYTSPDHPEERIKVSVFIVDKNLRSDALKVYVYTQAKRGQEWINKSTDVAKGKELEEIILLKARELYIHAS